MVTGIPTDFLCFLHPVCDSRSLNHMTHDNFSNLLLAVNSSLRPPSEFVLCPSASQMRPSASRSTS